MPDTIAAHTLEEWQLSPYRDGLAVFVGNTKVPIAFISSLPVCWKGNAHLISAAPELFEACEYTLRFLTETGQLDDWHPSLVDKLKSAIAKATNGEF